MNQARKDTTGIKLEVNERFVLFSFIIKACYTNVCIQILNYCTILL